MSGELCYQRELDDGFSAHWLGYSILIYKNGVPWLQVQSLEQMHETIELNTHTKGGEKYGKSE